MRQITLFAASAALLVLTACGPQKKNILARTYHNTTSLFNIYYHADQEYKQGVKKLEANTKLPPDGFISLLTQPDANAGGTAHFDTAIKKCDVLIYKHPNSNWVDDARFLNGRSSFYKGNYTMAVSNFRYILYQFPESKLVPDVSFWLAKTYYSTGNQYRAREVLRKLPEAKKIEPESQVALARIQSELFIKDEKYTEALAVLQDALPYVNTRRDKGLFNFLAGQLSATLGDVPTARDYFAAAARTNYSYELTFRALLASAGLILQDQGADQAGYAAVRRELDKLLEDIKYEDYHDQIYYQYGVIELANNRPRQALEYFKKSSATNTGNVRQQVLAQYNAGMIYFRAYAQYDSAQAYLDSASALVQPAMPEYDEISAIAKTLSAYVAYKADLHYQDSVLALVALDSLAQDKAIRKQIEKQEQLQRQREAEEKRKQQELQRQMLTAAQQNQQDPLRQTAAKFYFEDPIQIARGKAEFERVWGRRKNEDHWRRRNKQVFAGDMFDDAPEETLDPGASMAEKVAFFRNQLPLSSAQQDSAHEVIKTALFGLGQLFSLRLEEPDSAYYYYNELVRRYPGDELAPKSLYAAHTTMLDAKRPENEVPKQKILKGYPNSIYARLLLNQTAGAELTDNDAGFNAGYTSLLGLYDAGDYETVVNFGKFLIQQHLNNPEAHRLYFLRGAAFGELEKLDSLKEVYTFLTENFPEAESAPIAKRTLELLNNPNAAAQPLAAGAPDKAPAEDERFKGFELEQRNNEKIFAVAFVNRDKIKTADLNVLMADFNKKFYDELKLRASVFTYKTDTVDQHMIYVAQFKDYPTADSYVKQLQAHAPLTQLVQAPESDILFVSPANFRVAFSQRRFHYYKEFYALYKEQLLANGLKE